jgi:hypothetical protein
MKNKKVYDDRTAETIFVGTNLECVNFINLFLLNNPEDMDYIWIGNNEELGKHTDIK